MSCYGLNMPALKATWKMVVSAQIIANYCYYFVADNEIFWYSDSKKFRIIFPWSFDCSRSSYRPCKMISVKQKLNVKTVREIGNALKDLECGLSHKDVAIKEMRCKVFCSNLNRCISVARKQASILTF